jgi:HK97 family phage major capsid protein
MPVTTTDLFNIETINSLIVQPVFNQSVALSSGLTRMSTTATTVYIPSVAGGSAGWFKDLDPIGDAGISADETPITPKKCAATQVVSNESASDAQAANLVGQALTNALSQTVDEAFFTGGGVNGPAGLPGIAGISPVTGDPDASLDLYVDAISEVEDAGGKAGAIYVSPATWAALSKIKTNAGSTQPVLSPDFGLSRETTRSLFGVPVHTSRFVPADTAWVLDPSRVIVVERTPATVAVDTSIKFDIDATMLRATMRLEFTAPIPGVVAKIAP